MGRPRKAIRSIEKNISIPEDICAQIDLRLFSPLEGRVPHGAWSRYITGLIRKDISKKDDRPLISELYAACKEFVRKCECGEARSRRSYAQMKAAIERVDKEGWDV